MAKYRIIEIERIITKVEIERMQNMKIHEGTTATVFTEDMLSY